MQLSKNLAFEQKTMYSMLEIFCHANHCGGKGLCAECTELEAYCSERLHKCPFGENKPACQNCKVHCYHKSMRQRIREVMRFAGPRMIWSHPYLAFRHLYQTKFTPAYSLKEFKQLKTIKG